MSALKESRVENDKEGCTTFISINPHNRVMITKAYWSIGIPQYIDFSVEDMNKLITEYQKLSQ